MIYSCCGTLCAALFLLLTVPLRSQDYEVPRDSARFMTTVAGTTGQVQRQALQQKFVIGFNWGEVPHDSMAFKALHIKVVHEGLWPNYTSTSDAYRSLRQWYPWGTGTIHAHPDISQGTLLPYAWAPAMQFDPVVGNRGTVYRFTPRLGDTTGATWGFKQRDISVIDTLAIADSSDVNYDRVLFTDNKLKNSNQQLGLPLSTPRLVLSQPSPDELQFYDEIDRNRKVFDEVMRHADNVTPYTRSDMYLLDVRQTQHKVTMKRFFRDSTETVHYDDTLTVNGPVGFDTIPHGGDTVLMHMRGDSSGWYLAANLRRLANVEQNSVASGIPILSLRVPMQVRRDTVYYNQYGKADSTHTGTTHDTLYARFDSTAVAGNTIVHPQYGIMDNQLAAYDSTVFYIRAGMIPPDTTTLDNLPRPDITLSAHFWLPRFAGNNRYTTLQPKNTGQTDLLVPPGGGLIIPSPPWPGYPRTVIEPVVERVNMDVTYHGNVDVALDWLRFESRLARMILRGQKEKL